MMAMKINIYMDLQIMTYDIFTLRSESESECKDMFLKRERVTMDKNIRYEHQQPRISMYVDLQVLISSNEMFIS